MGEKQLAHEITQLREARDKARADSERLAEVLKQITPEANLYSIPIDIWQLGRYALAMHAKVTRS
jgi:hypothetical protein